MRDYSSLLPLEKPVKHTRRIMITTCRLDEDHVQIRAELDDARPSRSDSDDCDIPLHGMVVRFTVNRNMTITDADFATAKAPYVECNQFRVPAEKLVGLSAGKGFTRKIYEIYGGNKGCSHIVTLLANLAPALRQGLVFSMTFPDEEKNMTPENIAGTVQKMADLIEDSCMVWEKESEVQKDVARGELRDLPDRIYPNYVRAQKKK